MDLVPMKEFDLKSAERGNFDLIGISNHVVGEYYIYVFIYFPIPCILYLNVSASVDHWYLRSLQIQKRCEAIVKVVEKEVEDRRKQEEEEDAKEDARILEAKNGAILEARNGAPENPAQIVVAQAGSL